VKLSYSAIDNVLTNLLPTGLQDFFHVLNISRDDDFKQSVSAPQIKQYNGLKSGLFNKQFPGLYALSSLC